MTSLCHLGNTPRRTGIAGHLPSAPTHGPFHQTARQPLMASSSTFQILGNMPALDVFFTARGPEKYLQVSSLWYTEGSQGRRCHVYWQSVPTGLELVKPLIPQLSSPWKCLFMCHIFTGDFDIPILIPLGHIYSRIKKKYRRIHTHMRITSLSHCRTFYYDFLWHGVMVCTALLSDSNMRMGFL